MLRYWRLSVVCVLAGGLAQAQTGRDDSALDRSYHAPYATDLQIALNPIASRSLDRSAVASADRFSFALVPIDPNLALQTVPHGERIDIDANVLGLHRSEESMSSRDLAALDAPVASPANAITGVASSWAFAPSSRMEHDSTIQPVIREGDRPPGLERYRP